MTAMNTPVIELRDVHKRFVSTPDLLQKMVGAVAGQPAQTRTVHAVNGVNLQIGKVEVLGLVGESGCGKSTLGRVVAGLHPATEGQLLYQGRDVSGLAGKDRLAYTLGVQMVFQDPQASLNPRQKLHQILGEALHVHKLAPTKPSIFAQAVCRRHSRRPSRPPSCVAPRCSAVAAGVGPI